MIIQKKKIPNVGWGKINSDQFNLKLLNSVRNNSFYFTHSFFLDANKIGECMMNGGYKERTANAYASQNCQMRCHFASAN